MQLIIMKKSIIFLSLIFISKVNSQQLEFGANVGYSYSNIVNSNSDEKRVVIGNALWNTNYGLNALYYFKNPSENASARLNILYRNSKKGSVSEINAKNKYEFSTNTIGLTGGIGGDVGDGFILYLDAGFGFSLINNNDIFIGNLSQNEAFEDISEDLLIKNNEFVFLYALGVEKEISKKFKLYFEVNGDASITKLNLSSGSYITQGIGFSLGIRYFIKFNKV
ncbi:MAG: hypothetical protein ACK4UK_03675 [Flavobacterium sp.]